MTERHILVVDDDPKIRELLRDVLEGAGYAVTDVASGVEAVETLGRTAFDLITLDLQLGFEDGFDVARQIRAHSDVPIIMVTGRDDVVDRVVGLELGADDYITKPFHVREVLARVRTVLRRRGPATPAADPAPLPGEPASVFGFDGLVAVPERFELYDREGRLCELTSGDYRLLNVFVKNAKRVLSRDRLMDLTGGVDWTPLDRTIDNQVARLRKKIERNPADPQLIKTVRGIGYSFACEVTRLQSNEVPSNADSLRANSS